MTPTDRVKISTDIFPNKQRYLFGNFYRRSRDCSAIQLSPIETGRKIFEFCVTVKTRVKCSSGPTSRQCLSTGQREIDVKTARRGAGRKGKTIENSWENTAWPGDGSTWREAEHREQRTQTFISIERPFTLFNPEYRRNPELIPPQCAREIKFFGCFSFYCGLCDNLLEILGPRVLSVSF